MGCERDPVKTDPLVPRFHNPWNRATIRPVESYWHRDVETWRGPHDPDLPAHVDFAIVGGGLSGLSAAHAISQLEPTANVHLFEAAYIGAGASGRNAGFLSPLAAPVWLLSTRRNEYAWAAKEVHDRVHAVANALPETVERENAVLSLESHGRLTDSGLRECSDALARCSIDHAVRASRVRPGRDALTLPAYTVHPYRLVQRLADRATEHGVTIHQDTPVRAVRSDRIELARGHTVRANSVVLCTNAYTERIDTGLSIPARAVASFMVATPALSAFTLERLVRDGDFAVDLTLSETYHRLHKGRILMGGMDKKNSGGDVTQATRRALANTLAKTFPGREGLWAEHAWGGLLHTTRKELPIIEHRGLVLNVGYAGTGVALSLVFAPIVAALATGRPLAEDDARLLRLVRDPRLPVGDGLRAAGRVARRLFR